MVVDDDDDEEDKHQVTPILQNVHSTSLPCNWLLLPFLFFVSFPTLYFPFVILLLFFALLFRFFHPVSQQVGVSYM